MPMFALFKAFLAGLASRRREEPWSWATPCERRMGRPAPAATIAAKASHAPSPSGSLPENRVCRCATSASVSLSTRGSILKIGCPRRLSRYLAAGAVGQDGQAGPAYADRTRLASVGIMLQLTVAQMCKRFNPVRVVTPARAGFDLIVVHGACSCR